MSLPVSTKSLKNKTVLVTGAAGCIGSWVIKELNDLGAIPVAFDLSENRSRLELIAADASVRWIKGDITNYDQLFAALNEHNVFAVIHLAALQVPFAKADPIKGTEVNVMGTTHIFEACRQLGIDRICYASSIAAPAMGENAHLDTLYGAHKVCNEQMAKVYWQDWQLSSVCIRPGVIYGPGRDQGMSAAPMIALLAACFNQSYEVPFTGPVSYIHTQDAAWRFISAVAQEPKGAHIFDMNGVVENMMDVMLAIKSHFPGAEISATGDALPFPAEPDDGELDRFLGANAHREFTTGIADSLSVFQMARQNGILTADIVAHLIGKNS